MRILFDHGTPAPLAACLEGHTVTKALERGWDRTVNGLLLSVAEAAGFDVLLTTDRNMRYQQNLSGRRIALVILGNQEWPHVKLHVERIAAAVNACKPGTLIEVEISFLSR